MKRLKQMVMGVVAGALFLAVFAPVNVSAGTVQVGKVVNTAKGGEVSDNLYVGGMDVSIDSKVTGDLIGAGIDVFVADDILGDIQFIGSAININGDTAGDVRVGGERVVIAGDIAGELISLGAISKVSSGSVISGDALIVGGIVSMSGEVFGDLKIYGGSAIINGHVHGDVEVYADEDITISKNAVIDGALQYSARNEDMLKKEEGAVVAGGILFTESEIEMMRQKAEEKRFALFGIFIMAVLLKLVIFILAALVLVALYKEGAKTLIQDVFKNPLQSFFYGFTASILMPITAILLLMSVVGMPLGLMLLLSFLLLLLVSVTYSGVLAGVWVVRTIKKEEKVSITWGRIVVGAVFVVVIGLVPFVGYIITIPFWCMMSGAIIHNILKKIWKHK